MSKAQERRLTDWFDGMKFYPGASGVYEIICRESRWTQYSFFNAKTKKWNGGWDSVHTAFARSNWYELHGTEGAVDWMIERSDFRFRGLKGKP